VELKVAPVLVKGDEIVEAAPNAPVRRVRSMEPHVAFWFYIVINLPAEHVVRLVKVDVQELFERRKVSEGCGFYGPWDEVGLWKAPWMETQGAPRVNVSERGYSFDEIIWQLAPYLWVHLVFLGA